MKLPLLRRSVAAALCVAATASLAAPSFVNGLAIDATTLDASGGTVVNDGRIGFFSDIYYDPQRDEWWALSDRGPGGGTLHYETRVHRFKIDVDRNTGRDLQLSGARRPSIFRRGGSELDGFAPSGRAARPRLRPRRHRRPPAAPATCWCPDEYGPSLYRVQRAGRLVRRYKTPANLLPRDARRGRQLRQRRRQHRRQAHQPRLRRAGASHRTAATAYAMLQSAMLDEGGEQWRLQPHRRVRHPHRRGQWRSTRTRWKAARKAAASRRWWRSTTRVPRAGAQQPRRWASTPSNRRPNKKVFRIDLAGATDVSQIDLDAPAAVFTPVTKDNSQPWLDLAAPATLADASLALLGGVSPEKWEGLAIGPGLKDGSYLVLAGTDNDYSVTQDRRHQRAARRVLQADRRRCLRPHPLRHRHAGQLHGRQRRTVHRVQRCRPGSTSPATA